MQSDADLLFVEVDVFLTRDLLLGHGIDIQEVLADLATHQILFDDLFDVFEFDGAIEGVLWEDLDEWALRAESEATDVVDSDFVF